MRSSSPSITTGRVSSVPIRFGNVLPSYRRVKVLFASLTVYVPKFAMLPCTTALYSSGVPWTRLLEANFGRSERMTCVEKRPLSVKIVSPTVLAPHAGPPSGTVVEDETNVHAPTSCSFSDFCCAKELAVNKANANGTSVQIPRIRRIVTSLVMRNWVRKHARLLIVNVGR